MDLKLRPCPGHCAATRSRHRIPDPGDGFLRVHRPVGISVPETNVDFETVCERPLWAAAVDGYTFRRDQHGRVVARCGVCEGGFTVTEANAEAARGMMIIHRDGARR